MPRGCRFWHVWSRNNFTFSEKNRNLLRCSITALKKSEFQSCSNRATFWRAIYNASSHFTERFITARNLLGVVATKHSRHRFAQNKRAGKRPARFQIAVAALNLSHYFISRVGSVRESRLCDTGSNVPEPSTNKLHAPSSAAHKGNTAGRPPRC